MPFDASTHDTQPSLPSAPLELAPATRRAAAPRACRAHLSPLATDLGELRRYLAGVRTADVVPARQSFWGWAREVSL